MNKLYLAVMFMLISYLDMSAQLDITLLHTSNDSKKSCYQILLKNFSSNDVLLNGQNYRLYYNSSISHFIESSLKSFLTSSSYTDMEIVGHYFNEEASGFGEIPFEANLGFINISVDFKDNDGHHDVVKSDDELIIAEICFDILDDESKAEILWAQHGITDSYATAFVEISTYQDSQLSSADIREYKVIHNDITATNAVDVDAFSIYPNPFRDKLFIYFNYPIKTKAKLHVEDIFGRIHLSSDLDMNTSSFYLDVESLDSGSYFIRIIDGDGRNSVLKVIKVRS